MPTRPPTHKPGGAGAARVFVPPAPERKTTAQRGYGGRWQKARATFLARSPLCVECAKQDRTTAATVVDHIVPHKGDQGLFWDTSNWQSLCKPHHDAKTAREDGGFGNAVQTRSVRICGRG